MLYREHFIISLVITGITSLFLGIFVYLQNRKNTTNITFALYSVSIAWWALTQIGNIYGPDLNTSWFWARIEQIGVVFIPTFFLHFVVSFLGLKKKNKLLIFCYMFSSIIAILSPATSLISPRAERKFGVINFGEPGILYPYLMMFFCICTTYCLYKLFQEHRHSTGARRNQLKYLCWPSLVGYIGGSANFLLVYDINIYPLNPFGTYLVGSYVIAIAYAIARYQLMDISLVIKKGTVYTYLSFLVLIPCILFIILAQRFFFGEINYTFSSLVFGLLLLAAIIFSRTKLRVERFIERTLFKEKYEYKETLSKLSKVIISFLDEKKLFKKTSYILTHSLGIEKNSFFLLDRGKRSYTLRASKGLDSLKIKELPEDDLFFKWLKESGKIIVREELERLVDDPKIKPIVETLNSMESEVCIPLITRGELIGTINLGRKRSGDMYSHEDLELLGNLANQAAVALENARLYEDMKETQLLMRRSDRLAALGSLTAGLAHEIRNPLVAVKTFLQLLPERFNDEEFRSNFLSLTTSEVERITALVSELLEFARPSEPQLKRGDVNEVLQKVIRLITVEAKKRGIAINSDLEETPQAMLDEEQIKQVFLNIFLNAIEAISTSGNISVTSGMTQKNGLEYVQVRIEDTGKGIPKKILEHIFDPFFTTKEKGSGLGLSISHQIVQEHNGSIEVESKSGKGTTFFVNLPCVK